MQLRPGGRLIALFTQHREVAALALANPATPFALQCQLQARLRQTASRIIGLQVQAAPDLRVLARATAGAACTLAQSAPLGNHGDNSFRGAK